MQIITDNASNYGLAYEMIIGQFPHIYANSFAAHGIQLLLKDIFYEVDWVKKIFDDAAKK